MLTSTNAKNYKVWGDFDASILEKKVKFFYWFRVYVENEHNERLMEDISDR
jgi:hypothetical protein